MSTAVTAVTTFDEIVIEFPDRKMALLLAADGDDLVGVRFGTAADHAAWLAGAEYDPGHPAIQAARAQLEAYAAGLGETFDVPLRLDGSEFQRSVWQALQEIPYGEITTYGALAAAVGRPGQARAIGGAVGANPLGIIVPCHRVIGANGSLTGFGGGLDNKVTLLAREGITAL
jgi:methylated-DNA-[protein]-cysteine S-methyltransferase